MKTSAAILSLAALSAASAVKRDLPAITVKGNGKPYLWYLQRQPC